MENKTVIKRNLEQKTGYALFISEEFVSLSSESERIPVKILRDTGSSESFVLESLLPFSASSNVGKNVLIWGITLQTLSLPQHKIILKSPLVNGEVIMGV